MQHVSHKGAYPSLCRVPWGLPMTQRLLDRVFFLAQLFFHIELLAVFRCTAFLLKPGLPILQRSPLLQSSHNLEGR